MQSRRIVRCSLALASVLLALASNSCRGMPTLPGIAPSGPNADGACPPGARAQPDGCTCRADLRPLLGACVAPAVAADACGPSGVAAAGGCLARTPCEPGRARDLVSGECLARRDVRNLAASLGIMVGDDELVGCPPESELAAVSGGQDLGAPRLGCLPRVAEPSLPPCPAGSVRAASGPRLPGPGGAGSCIPIFARRPGGPAAVDVARWAEAAIGADGGPGAPPLCRAWGRSAAFLGSATPTEARFVVTLTFADNDVSLVVAAVRSAEPAAATELDRTLAPAIEAVRALGGTASQASLTTAVRCVRSAGARPASLPGENDHER